ncbi:hypothetical protein E2C01_003982 [Portunus trituberculatus]|uniref:Uncharacterized protein n=1 Tax=Portunus trituberculatus TaxID=210409 RepID=A0A5B7CPE9_PORTR|nr:hypothetical protein [Portunus trituberculatus]
MFTTLSTTPPPPLCIRHQCLGATDLENATFVPMVASYRFMDQQDHLLFNYCLTNLPHHHCLSSPCLKSLSRFASQTALEPYACQDQGEDWQFHDVFQSFYNSDWTQTGMALEALSTPAGNARMGKRELFVRQRFLRLCSRADS